MSTDKTENFWDKKIAELLDSSYEDTGSIFPNAYKKQDKHPDYQGCGKFNVVVDGIERTIILKISSWVKIKSSDQSKWLSLKMQAMKVVNKGEENAEEDRGSEAPEEPEDQYNPF